MGNPIFYHFSKEAVSVPQGSVIMREGEIGQCAYFVVQGRLLVEKEIAGENIPIAEIGPRDMVGELAILDDAPRSATVTALENSVLFVLNKHRIRSLIRRSPAVAEVIMKLLCHKLRNRTQIVKQPNDLDHPDIWRKICNILLLCTQGETHPTSLYRNFALQLHRLLEIPTDNILEVLKRLETAGTIDTQNQKTLCVDEHKLELFVKYSTEEYANIPILVFSDVMEYRAVQVLLQTDGDLPEQEVFIEMTKSQWIQILVGSSLWNSLRPHYQVQRAEAMIQQLIGNGILELSPNMEDRLRIYPEAWQNMKEPQASSVIYASMKVAFAIE